MSWMLLLFINNIGFSAAYFIFFYWSTKALKTDFFFLLTLWIVVGYLYYEIVKYLFYFILFIK